MLLCRDLDARRSDFPFQSTCVPQGVLDRFTVGDGLSNEQGGAVFRLTLPLAGAWGIWSR